MNPKLLTTLAAALLAAAALQGCASAAADESAVISNSRPAPAAASSEVGTLAFGVYGLSSVTSVWTGKPFEKPDMAGVFINAGSFGSPQLMTGAGCRSCDVVAVVKCSEDAGSGPAAVKVVSTRTKRTLFSSQKSGGGCDGLVQALGREVSAAFRPGTPLYARVVEERGPRPAAAEAPSSVPAAKPWWDKGSPGSTR